ncbi:MAG: winged helix-turn-helix transcriptional regulator [Planctomycetota bacterium]|nr:winged helix-turn-helix transcriptional regulator [Planctomycetota bacterium]
MVYFQVKAAVGRIQRLVTLFHHRWAVPVLAELQRGKGAKLVTLVQRLGAGRDVLRPTLDRLIEHGWVVRNSGYGHPLRPEYVLSRSGKRIAPACARLWQTLRRSDLTGPGLKKWSLPVAWVLERSGGRFGDAKQMLPGITSRALTLALKTLQEAGLVRREVVDGYPPRPRYHLTPRGRRLVPLVGGL